MNASSHRLIVLCVDDNEEVLQSLRRELRRGLKGRAKIELCSSAEMALERLEALPEAARVGIVIVSDWLMPNMRGDEFVRAVNQRYGDLPVVVLSGHISGEAAEAMRAMPQVRTIMPKPWPSNALLNQIESTLKLAPTTQDEP